MLRSRNIIRGLILSVVLGTALTGCGFSKDKNSYEVPTLVQQTTASNNKKTVKVQKGDLERDNTMSGKVIASVKTDLSFGSAQGYISKINVKVGDTVKKGDVIAELNKEELQYEIKQQEIEVQLAQLDADEAQKTPGSSDYDKQKAALKLQSEKLKLDSLNEHLNNSVLISNVAGVVISMPDVKMNQQLQPFEAVATIADTSDYEVECDVKNAQLTPQTKVKIAMKGIVNSDYVEGQIVDNRIDNTGGDKDNSKIIVKFSTQPKGLSLGAEAIVSYTEQKVSNVLYLPDSIIKKGSGNHPYVEYVKDGDVSEKYIETGLDDGNNIEIVSGLAEGDTVISE